MTAIGVFRLRIAIFIGFLLLISLIAVLSVDYYRDKMRDSVRLADMAIVQSAMNRLYMEKGNYFLGNECQVGSLLSGQGCFDPLSTLIGSREFVMDPKETDLLCVAQNCGVRSCNYTVGRDFDSSGYRIYFHMERGIASLSAGCHYLDQEGIH